MSFYRLYKRKATVQMISPVIDHLKSSFSEVRPE